MGQEFGPFDLNRIDKKLIHCFHECDYSICYNSAFTFGVQMIDFLMSGYGLSSMGLLGIILFLVYLKLMKWVFKVAIFGIIALGAFWYFNPPTLG